MRPLQAVGLGLIVVALVADFGGYDGLPDPIGWILILLGTRGVARRTELGAALALTYLGALALIVATVLWFPSAEDALVDADPALVWAADLPALSFQALLCHGLAGLAAAAGERTPATWFRLTSIGLVIAMTLPVLYHAGGVEALEGTGDVGLLLQLLVLGLTLWYSGRPWTGAEPRLPRSVARATEREAQRQSQRRGRPRNRDETFTERADDPD